MPDLHLGDVVRGGSAGQGTEWWGVILRIDGLNLQILDPGISDLRRGFLRRLTYTDAEQRGRDLVLEGVFTPLDFPAGPLRPPEADAAAIDAALDEFLEATVPGSAVALRAVPPVKTRFHSSYFSELQLSRTAAGLRIAIDVSDFDSGDMVRIEHHWRWAVLFRPLVVVGVYRGDRGKQAQLLHEAALPAPAVETLSLRLGAAS